MRLQIWGSGVRISSGAPAILLSCTGFSIRCLLLNGASLQLVCKLCSRGVLEIENCLLGKTARAGEVTL